MLSLCGRSALLAAAAAAVSLHLGLSAAPAVASGGKPGGGVTCPELVPDCDINARGGGGKGEKPKPGGKSDG
ncbi:hypothetical protein, partial [Streptomyces rhizosphaericus]